MLFNCIKSAMVVIFSEIRVSTMFCGIGRPVEFNIFIKNLTFASVFKSVIEVMFIVRNVSMQLVTAFDILSC
jgi:hypothetical protein